MSWIPRHVWIPVVVAALLVFGWQANTRPLTNWDEGIYANVNLELWQGHDWTKLTYFGRDFLEKPPLQFWLTSLSFGIFSPTELGLRVWSILAGAGTAVLLAVWMWQLTSRRALAWCVAGLFVLGRFSLQHAFRTGDLDGLLVLWFVLALYAYWRSWKNPKWLLVWGAASAAAVMTKSLAGALPVIIVAVDVVLARRWRTLSWRMIGWSCFTFLALAAPWHVVETVRFGRAFWAEYLGWNIVQRSAESLFTPTPWYFYLQAIRDRFFPFSYALPLALWLATRRAWRRDEMARLLLLWIGVVAIVYTVLQTRRDWYILPLYPALAMLLGLAMREWWSQRWTKFGLAAAVVSGVLMFGYQATDFYFQNLLRHVSALQWLTTPAWTRWWGQVVLGAGGVAVVWGIVWLWRRTIWTQAQRAMIISSTVMFGWSLLWVIQYTRSLPMTLPLKSIAARLDQERLLNVEYIGTKLKKEPAGYFYLLRLPLRSVELPVGTRPTTPVILTTTGPENAPLNTRGRILLEAGKFRLIDFR